MNYFSIVCLSVVLAGCTSHIQSERSSPPTQSATINFNDSVHGLHLEYPANWVEQGLPASGQVLLVLQLPESNQPSPFPPTLQLSMQVTGGPLKLAQIEHAVVERGQNSFADFQLMSNTPATLGNEPARQIIYKGTSSGIALQTMTVIALHGGQGFAVSFAADPKEFESRLPAVQGVLGSFSFTR